VASSPNCREVSRILSAALDRALTPAEVDALQYHLPKCVMCRDFEGQLKFLHAAAGKFREGGGP
jgi:Putative zinc-finger